MGYLPPAYVVQREGNVLTHICLSVCLRWGVSHVWGGGYPISGLGGGYPISGLGRGMCHLSSGGYPMSGGFPMSGGEGYPISAPPLHCTEQHSEHLLRGRRCASCVHAGGLSCLRISIDLRSSYRVAAKIEGNFHFVRRINRSTYFDVSLSVQGIFSCLWLIHTARETEPEQ